MSKKISNKKTNNMIFLLLPLCIVIGIFIGFFTNSFVLWFSISVAIGSALVFIKGSSK
ncbi:septum formation initiator [Ruminiclostridium josui]|uniref:septum formation initiator n=1 Tax=Ruminiclostridium josui TaxID=1499 RepID=UPI0004B3E213|nr:septum formation initiator [Ruminiclostridium josui]